MKKAFTLLEMLIVLGIIAVMLSVLTVSYSTAQKKSRDAKRKGDIKAIQSTLEQYYSACGYNYPTPDSGSIPDPIRCVSPSIMFLTVAPKDPKTNTDYTYTSSGSDFSICTSSMEMEGSTSFCLNNQQ